VSAWSPARVVPVAGEAALAFCAGAASFAAVALVLASTDSDALAVGLGALCIVAVVAITRWWGVAYAVPAAMAALLAFDWFQFPPIHAAELPGSRDLADLVAYLSADGLRRRARGERTVARGHLRDRPQRAGRRAGRAAARRDPCRVRGAPGGGVRRGRRGGGRLLGADVAEVYRYEDERTATVVATWGDRSGARCGGLARVPGARPGIPARVRLTWRPGARLAGAIGAPVSTERVWGAVVVESPRARAVPRGQRAPGGRVHRPGGCRDREQPGAF